MAALAFCCLLRLHGIRGEISGDEGVGEAVAGDRTEEGEVVGAEETGGRVGLVVSREATDGCVPYFARLPGGLDGPGGEVWGDEGMGEAVVGERTEEGEAVGAEETGGRMGLVDAVACERRARICAARSAFARFFDHGVGREGVEVGWGCPEG